MNRTNYLFKSLWFFRRQHLVLFIGTVISTAILTGALIVGDSVKYSLQHLVDLRLGHIRYALVTGDRFVRSQLADELADSLHAPVASVLQLNGILSNPDNNQRVNHAQVLGITPDFWKLSDSQLPDLNESEAFVNSEMAEKLKVNPGDELVLRVQKVSLMPLSAPFARETDPSMAFRVKIKSVLNDHQMGRFSLKSNQASPYSVFISQAFLQQKLELAGKANLILVGKSSDSGFDEKRLNQTLKNCWNLEDAQLEVRNLPENRQYEVLSERVFIDEPLACSMMKFNPEAEPVLTYLVNSLKVEQLETPYSFATAAGFSGTDFDIKPDQVIINQWLADDLKAKPGDSLTMSYFVPGPLRTLLTREHTFQIKRIIPIHTGPIQPDLMPDYPGLSDATSCRNWDAGVPIDLKTIRDKDEAYWNQYRGTPKAIISLEDGLKLWSNQLGSYTAIRFPENGKTEAQFKQELIAKLTPQEIGFYFAPVYRQGIYAASHGVDFGQLFLSLSFFVIAGSLILLIVLYLLYASEREFENTTLSSLGFSYSTILKIRIYETLPVLIAGSIAGAFMGIVYNIGVMHALNSVWNDAVRTHQLEMMVNPVTLFIGAFSGLFITLLSIIIITRRMLRNSLLHSSENSSINKLTFVTKQKSFLRWFLILSLIGAIGLVGYSVATSVDTHGSLFLSAGALFLVALLVIVYQFFVRYDKLPLDINFRVMQLALKNCALRKGRSMAIIVLLALGTFSIIITGANRKTFYGVEQSRKSGTGGFLFWGETSLPVPFNMNTAEGRQKLGIDKDDSLFKQLHFVQFYNQPGDDASCLNLNQVQNPGILGVNSVEFDQLKAFSFVSLLKGIDPDSPWLALNQNVSDSVVPGYADQTVITWGLIKKVEDTLHYRDEFGKPLDVVLTGGLASSVFQGNLLISDQVFAKHFPSVSSESKQFLLDAPVQKKEEIASELSAVLKDYGVDLTETSQRLATFNSVTNTYLDVFLILGGLGILIGTIGLGIIILRNMMERNYELALFTALGIEKKKMFRVIFTENTILLLTGLLIGVLGAWVGMLPSLLSPSFSVPFGFISIILLIILLNGGLWIWFSVHRVMRNNLFQSLRNE